MDRISILFAKIAALKKNFDSLEYRGGRILAHQVEHLLKKYVDFTNELISTLPELYSDLPTLEIPKEVGLTSQGPLYEKEDIEPIVNNLDYILEVRANYRIGEAGPRTNSDFIFISHGHSKEWYKLQAYLEKDLEHKTLELAQQPNLGRTILNKLDEETEKCNTGIIVMTGDDVISQSEIRARQNVLHEIGFLQGKLGLNKVIILHEEGVDIPSNIHGLVYISFPKETIEATYGAITRELKVMVSK